jgi:diguanylate cyclase (GGDEF)-like protein/PAS domain S-box-containing protein
MRGPVRLSIGLGAGADAVRALALGLAFFAVAAGALAVGRWATGMASIWPANALLLLYLLTVPRSRWAYGVATAFVAGVAANWLAGSGIALAAAYAAANLVEALLLALILARRDGPAVDVERLVDLGRLVLGAMLGSGAGATVAASAALLLGGRDYGELWGGWFVATLLGMMIVAPILLIGRGNLRPRGRIALRDLVEGGAALALVGLVGGFVFSQNDWPLLFVLHPPVLVATFRLRGLGAALATLLLAAIGTAGVVLGSGPFALIDGTLGERIALLQLFLAVTILTALPTAALLAERDRVARRLSDREEQFRTVVDVVSDVIFRTDDRGRWTFLNPAWETLSGYSTAEALGQSFLHYVAEEDREPTLTRLRGMSAGLFDSVRCIVRYKHRDGGVRWVEVLTHRLLDETGALIGSAGTLVDVSDRVALAAHAEEARRRAERDAQAAMLLAATDELTGLASRRAFLNRLEQELAGFAQGGRMLAIALFDIDHFKRVNDRYGHLAGDEVLERVARLARRSVRDQDLVGRLGGEEFAVLMPGATMAEAVAAGERLRAACAAAAHPSCPGLMVTISVGVAAAETGSTATSLLHDADAALYRAKNSGRNCLRIAA